MGVATSKDMALCFVFFNPANSKRMIMNYLYVSNVYKNAGLPVYTIELTFPGQEHVIPDAVHVRSKSFMFHKERLCRMLEREIPRKYTKLVFLDADILFDQSSWYKTVSKLLDTHDVVQPFEFAHWMDLSYTTTTLTRETAVKMKNPKWDFTYHPGFAWAFRRSWYRDVGFFDWAVTGSGDTLSVAAWMGKEFPEKFKSLPLAMKKEYEQFLKRPKPTIGYAEGIHVRHLYHGSRKNRQYAERHAMMDVPRPIRSLIKYNWCGAYEWTDTNVWNPVFLDYFTQRQDDDVDVTDVVIRSS